MSFPDGLSQEPTPAILAIHLHTLGTLEDPFSHKDSGKSKLCGQTSAPDRMCLNLHGVDEEPKALHPSSPICPCSLWTRQPSQAGSCLCLSLSLFFDSLLSSLLKRHP